MRLRFLAHEADFYGFPGGWLTMLSIKANYLRWNVHSGGGGVMVHRSIEIKSMKFKAGVDFNEIKRIIKKTFGEVFALQYKKGYVTVSGDLHDYKTREKLYEIITARSIGG
jgi:hypothetical protein